MVETLEQVGLLRIPTGIMGAEVQDDFIMTDKAVETVGQIKEQNEIPEEYNLRIGTRSGGCSGMNYNLVFDSEINEDDRVIEVNGTKLVIDNKSLFYIQGVTLDFVDGPSGSGFVFNNPNNSHTCGCSH
jgi:iron-sulfur cluster assembly protein